MSDQEVELLVKLSTAALRDDLNEFLTEYLWAHVNEEAQTDEFYEKLGKVSDQFADTFKAKML